MNDNPWHSLVVLRHGQSEGNAEGTFTGLLDAPLTPRGREEAARAGQLMTTGDITPDLVITSPMRRARETANIVIDAMRQPPPIIEDWRLSERHYGALSGLSKEQVLEEYGEEQFLEWRRTLYTPPPPHPDGIPVMDASVGHPFGDNAEALGATESLHDVVARVDACYQERIMPALQDLDCVLVVAHGNSLRALCVLLDTLNEDAVRELNLPTGHPLVYELDSEGRSRVAGGAYLDPAGAYIEVERIAQEGYT